MTRYVTISLQPQTREMLKDLGRKGDTYDDLIRGLIRKSGKRPRSKKKAGR